MADFTPNPSEPVVVTASATKVFSRETVKMLVAGGFAYAAAQMVHSEIALAAIVPLGGFLGIWVYGVYERLHNWRIAKFMAHILPDDTARVGHK